jgi:hypothetical protein
MLQFFVGAASVFFGLSLLSLPVIVSNPELAPLTRRSLASFLLTILLISLSLSALAE